jgi:mycothiol system anti-sigma-R factor
VTVQKPACARAAEQVYFYLDNEMSSFRRWRVKHHLRKCPPCSSQFDFEAEFKRVVRRKSQDPAPPELIDRLRAFLREHGAGD